MRCATASEFKRGKWRRRATLQAAPKENSHLRRIYDLFQGKRGIPIEFPESIITADIRMLTDFYGLDIRHAQRGSKRHNIKTAYVLAGEWFGKVYIDYIAEHLASLEKRDAA